ncbi:hypothetical protein F5ESL0236_08355, partial [Lactobacillus sp. ESL0236]|uniref:hypothetical protein n=1 Tax=unclassified Lactobacillus TaxID=2620435 RepID=UPI000F139C49
MAKKKCGICGKQLGFWDSKISVKDGVICCDCFYKGNFYGCANRRRINKFIDTQTVTEMKELIDNPEKLQAVKRKVAPANHHHRKP